MSKRSETIFKKTSKFKQILSLWYLTQTRPSSENSEILTFCDFLTFFSDKLPLFFQDCYKEEEKEEMGNVQFNVPKQFVSVLKTCMRHKF